MSSAERERGLGAILGPFLLLAAVAGALVARWDKLPERFPVHWGLAGQPDRWGSRTPIVVLGPLLFGALLVGLMLMIGLGVVRARYRAVEGPGAARERALLRLVRGCLLGAAWTIALIFAVVGAIPLLSPALGPNGLLTLILVLSFGSPAVLLGLALGAAKLPPRLPPDRAPREDGSWKWGLFYVNPDDPAVWVEKRFGIGYTLNLGQPAGRFTFLALLASPLLLAALALLLLR
jgi:uncharacterized membrane protein